MAKVQIEIPGIGMVTAENAASESTLRELVTAVNGVGASGTGSPGGGAGGAAGGIGAGLSGIAGIAGLLGLLGRSVGGARGANNAVKGLTGAIGTASGGLLGGLFGLTKGVFKFGGALTGFAIGAVTNFAKTLMFGENNLQTLVSTIPLVGKHLQQFAGILDTTLTTYRQLTEVGASFGNNMFGFMKSAIDAEMSLTDFATFVANNTQSLAIMGGSVTEGARQFANLSREMRTGGIAEQLYGMGFTVEELNDGLTTFYEENARSGRIRRMSDAQIVQGAQEYALELDRLAKLTGMSRREAAQSRLEVLSDAKIRAMANHLEGQARENFINNMTMINRITPGMATAFDDLADGVAQTDVGRALMRATDGQAAEVARMIAEGADPELIRSELSRLGPVISDFAASLGPARLDTLRSTDPALYAILNAEAEISRLGESSAGIISDEQNARDQFTTFMGNLEQAMQSFKSNFLDYFVNSEIFDNLRTSFGNLDLSVATSKDLFDELKPALDATSDWFSGFFNSFGGGDEAYAGGPVQYVTDSVNGMLRSMFGVEDDQTLSGAAQAKMTEWFENTMTWLKENALPPAEQIGGYVSDALGVLWENIKEAMLPSVGQVVAGGLAAIGTAAAIAFAPISVPLLAIGTAAASIGVLVGGLFDDVVEAISNFSIMDSVRGMINSVTGIFDFEMSLPNFSDYLPTWMGGEGRPLTELFAGDSSSTTRQIATAGPTPASTAPDLGTVTANQAEIQQTNSEIATAATQLAESADTQKNIETLLKDLNTTMLAVLDVNDRSDRTFDRVRRNLALNYNLG